MDDIEMQMIDEAMEVFLKTYIEFRGIHDKHLFLSLIGMVIDQWAVDHQMGQKEKLEMIESLHDACEFVNSMATLTGDELKPTW